MSGRVVYAMRVTDKMSMEDYDTHATANVPGEVPRWFDRDCRRRAGDSLYDFTTNPPRQRRGVHDARAVDRDLGGQYRG